MTHLVRGLLFKIWRKSYRQRRHKEFGGILSMVAMDKWWTIGQWRCKCVVTIRYLLKKTNFPPNWPSFLSSLADWIPSLGTSSKENVNAKKCVMIYTHFNVTRCACRLWKKYARWSSSKPDVSIGDPGSWSGVFPAEIPFHASFFILFLSLKVHALFKVASNHRFKMEW